ncbi:M20 peptidase aminoacylase family protein [Bacillus shivajii]|uniref:M20 peptidase aminoacylase family protein n=1 Tax=Bacillus shivajii TaxID=1983719 RepID=UPI001CFA52E2|nr:M20 peptidase aminoacylase family protein [Bacillus shivajii]UCZ52782.1 M20 peptidase aminoacylase family protein [Bacillus shivajii]
MLDQIKTWAEKNEENILATYHELHENPEISWEEKETTSYIRRELEKMDIECKTFDDLTGLIGYWGDRDVGPTVALRADMDALWQKVDGHWQANHSCGHDAHMTMVLHVIKCLKETGFQPEGLLKIIFQPAEETGKGAKAIIDQGVVKDVDYLLGVHVRPIQEMAVHEASPAIYHGATTLLIGEINGVQAHGARPHLGVNVVDSLANVVHAVNSIKMDPTVPATAKVTVLNAGGKNVNVIPDFGEFAIDVRAQTNEAMEEFIHKVKETVVKAGSANGATVEVNVAAEMAAATSNSEMEEVLGEAIVDILGADGLKEPPVTPGGEDFHFYSNSSPNLKATMLGLGTDLQPGLHHPNMTFDLSSLSNGVQILSLATKRLFEVPVTSR